jgi:hypothetical protein
MKELIEELNKNILQLIQENKILQQQIQYQLFPQLPKVFTCNCHCNCSKHSPLFPNYIITNGTN